MTAQLSREIVENLLHHNDESDSPANAEAWEVNALCRLALAGMESEPVAYPEKLPCPVLLEPGMRFGKGVKTRLMLEAMHRRAEYYAELDAMKPEQRAEHDAALAEFKAILPAPVAVPSGYRLQPISEYDAMCAAMLNTGPVTAATVPDGWKLVPVEPTEAMLDAAYSHPASTEDRMRKQYASMLAAAPAAPEQEV